MKYDNTREFIYEELLSKVEKPGRYIGTEWNSIHKNPETIDIRFAFCFPDVYEVGMSHLGMKILYHLLNDQQDIFCERVFAPWPDMEEVMRKTGIKLFGLESRDFIDSFDFVGFTLQYEMSYTNIVNRLDLAGIPKDPAKEMKAILLLLPEGLVHIIPNLFMTLWISSCLGKVRSSCWRSWSITGSGRVQKAPEKSF